MLLVPRGAKFFEFFWEEGVVPSYGEGCLPIIFHHIRYCYLLYAVVSETFVVW